jgi:translation initiation factor IF-3
MARNNYNSRGRNRRDRGPRKNHQIRVQEVRLIDENEDNQGVVSIQEAMSKANNAGKDLVEVAPKANPPVCKIMDYSKYLYEQEKKEKSNKQKRKPMKEFRFSPVIEEHDANNKASRAKEYLDKGHKVKISMFRKGRQPREIAEKRFDEILTKFDDYSTIEPKPKKQGRKIYVTFKPNG